MSRTEVSRPIAENLIKVEAFDDFGTRSSLLQQFVSIITIKQRTAKGTVLLPEHDGSELNSAFEQPSAQARMDERDLLSIDLSAHPLDHYLNNREITQMKDLPSLKIGAKVKLAGGVIRYQTPPTRNGNRVVYIIMEDGTGIADVTVFNNVQQACGEVLFREPWLVVTGKIQKRGPKATSVIADKLEALVQNGK
jgi:error-prone DNA polymerase